MGDKNFCNEMEQKKIKEIKRKKKQIEYINWGKKTNWGNKSGKT